MTCTPAALQANGELSATQQQLTEAYNHVCASKEALAATNVRIGTLHCRLSADTRIVRISIFPAASRKALSVLRCPSSG